MAQSIETTAVMQRYNDAYIVARATDGIGNGIKGIGIVLGIIVVAVSFLMIAADKSGFLQLGIVGIVFGCFIGTLLYIFGVLVSAQGQTLKASLDSAVNSSPFLTNVCKAEVMSLPKPKTLAASDTSSPSDPHALDNIQF